MKLTDVKDQYDIISIIDSGDNITVDILMDILKEVKNRYGNLIINTVDVSVKTPSKSKELYLARHKISRDYKLFIVND